MSNTKIAITGLGVVSPAGMKKATFWANLKSGRSFVEKIERFDPSLYQSQIGGQVHDLDAYSHISGRLSKKIDVFAHMALVAAEEAFKDSKVDMDKADKTRMGAFMGNAIGGWLFAETELRDMYIEGREGVSPFMASAWFPAAPQGQVTIYYGIKGYSKTVVSDRASSALAIWYAAKTLHDDKNDICIAGGMEAPITPYSLLCCNTQDRLSKNNLNPKKAYRPYELHRDGFALGEGSGMVILEKDEKAKERGAHIYGYVKGFGYSCDGYHRSEYDPKPEALEYAIKMCIKDAGWQIGDVDYVCLDAEGTVLGDILEVTALKNVFGARAKTMAMSAPKSMYGNLLGAQTSLDLVATLMSIEHDLVLPTINFQDADPRCDINCTPNKAMEKKINKAIIIARGRGGINMVLGIEK
jgi:3-oxoacyl-[acyl-carrier-protein] synthase II